jgi:hypothetical protein
LGRCRNTTKGCSGATRLYRDTLQQIAEERQLLTRERLLTHEVFVAKIQTLLHESSTLTADSQLSLQTSEVRFLLRQTSSTKQFPAPKQLIKSGAICFHTLEAEQRTLPLLLDVELLRP